MARVVANMHRNLALEVVRGEKTVAFVQIDGAAVVLRREPKREFDQEYFQENLTDSKGELSPRRMSRHYLGLKQYPLEGSAIAAMVDIMALSVDEARSDHTAILTDGQGALIGAYESTEDASLIAPFYPGTRVVRRVEHMVDWTEEMIETLRQQVAPALKARNRKKLLEGVLAMAKVAAKPATKAVAKVEKTKKERKAKEDGPVFQVKAFVEKNLALFKAGKLTTSDARAQLLAQGINKGTIGVQLSKQLKANGVTPTRGERAKKEKAAKAEIEPAKVKRAKKNGQAAAVTA